MIFHKTLTCQNATFDFMNQKIFAKGEEYNIKNFKNYFKFLWKDIKLFLISIINPFIIFYKYFKLMFTQFEHSDTSVKVEVELSRVGVIWETTFGTIYTLLCIPFGDIFERFLQSAAINFLLQLKLYIKLKIKFFILLITVLLSPIVLVLWLVKLLISLLFKQSSGFWDYLFKPSEKILSPDN